MLTVKQTCAKFNCKKLMCMNIVRSDITYTIVTWGSAAKVHIKKIQAIQNKIFRIITNVSWFVTNEQLYKDLDIPSIHYFIRETAIKLFQQDNLHMKTHFFKIFYTTNLKIAVQELGARD